MAVNRANIVDKNFLETVKGFVAGQPQADLDQPVRPGFRLTGRQAIACSRPWSPADTWTLRAAH